MTRQSFVYGAFVLLLAGLFNRIMGFIYQVLIVRLIQPEGVGLFNMVYPIYILVVVLASAGIPLAVAKLVAEEVARHNLRGAYRIFRLALGCIFLTSTLLTILLVLGVPFLQYYVFPNPKVYYCFVSLLPAVVVVSLCSAFRGFFQGLQQMTPTAVSQIIEQLVRATTGLIIATVLLPRGVEYGAIGVSLGVVCGEFVGFMVMLGIYFTRRPVVRGTGVDYPSSLGKTLGRIADLAFPVTLTRFVSTTLLSIDALLIPRRLCASGMTLSQATAAYGQLVGIAEPLVFTPGILTISLATALVPAISEALAQNNLALVRGRTEEALRLTFLAGFPAAVIFWLLPGELCALFFGYPEAGVALGTLALGGPFLYLQQTTTGILQGLGRAERPLKNLVIASVFKIAGIYYLTGLPHLGIRGAAVALTVGYAVMSLLNCFDLLLLTRMRPDWGYCFGRPAVAAVGMALVMLPVKWLLAALPLVLRTPGVLLAGAFTYLLLLVVSGAVHASDLGRLKEIFYWFRRL